MQLQLIPLADETQGVQIKLCYPLTMLAGDTVAIVFTHCRNTKLDDVKLYVNGKTIKM